MDTEQIRIKDSVRNLVEFCLKDGDLDNRFTTSARAVEGTRAHQKLQADNLEIYDNYKSEVYLTYDFVVDNITLSIEGRADGIIVENNKIIIEEIKSTYKKYSYIDDLNELHWAQAKVYGFIYCSQNDVDEVTIRLSYVQLDDNEVKSFEKRFLFIELKKFIDKIINYYINFAKLIYENKKKRDETIKSVVFPFEEYREGQRRLINIVYNTIKEQEILFAQAPTGIGKTISTIFPAVKAIGEGKGKRIIYLTSKVVNREVANEAINKLREEGLYFSSITLTAKEKACCNNVFDCNPEVCKYAKGYYGKVRKVISEIINNVGDISYEVLRDYAEKYEVCPFELSLDVSLYCDAVICDYNYIFDPSVSIGRITESEGNIVLVDEAHNLIDRSRNMYSSSLDKASILECRKITKGKLNKISSVLNKINSFFIEIRNECEDKQKEWFYENEEPKSLIKLIKLFIKESEQVLARGSKFEGYDQILQLYFDMYSFMTISQMYDKNYVTIVKNKDKNVYLNLFCVNTADNLKKCIDKCYAVIFFSATFSPITYYIKMLGGNDNTYRVKLSSPFEKSNLKTYIAPINIRYSYRKHTLPLVLKKVEGFVNSKIGNYIIFCPSYAYLDMMWDEINKYNFENFKVMKQNFNMTDEEKKQFLNMFKEQDNLLVFCVLGGMFSEGIDLPGEQLIGCTIIGVGYPKIDVENEIIKEFYKENGYDYAYIYPGINKVQQAAGRVIRTENDKGRILLIDERFVSAKYGALLPKEWYPISKY